MLDDLAEMSVRGVAIGKSQAGELACKSVDQLPPSNSTLNPTISRFVPPPLSHEFDLGVYPTPPIHETTWDSRAETGENRLKTLSSCLKTADMHRRGFLLGDPGSDILQVKEVKP